MFDFVFHLLDDLHPILNHFPIALLVISFLLVLFARKRESLRQVEWLAFAWGATMCLPAAISGLVAHEAYETSSIHMTIEQHGLPANAGTLVMLGFAIWRYRSRRKDNDIARRNWYPAFAVIGLLWIFFVGGTGGSLTYDHGVNVRGVNPLLSSDIESSSADGH